MSLLQTTLSSNWRRGDLQVSRGENRSIFIIWSSIFSAKKDATIENDAKSIGDEDENVEIENIEGM